MEQDERLLPPLIRHWFRSECPECGLKWMRTIWDPMFYPLHYATVHLDISPWRTL